MPEYLSPGVYIEETSFRGKPIEGVSTSTCGLVGRAKKGPVNRSLLVTSFADFTRAYGTPYDNPSALGDYLGHAVQAFFNNGGKRAYIVRVLSKDATPSKVTLSQGTIYRLRQTVRVGDLVIPLSSLRGFPAGAVKTLQIFTRPSPNAAFQNTGSVTADSYDPLRNNITLPSPGLVLPSPLTKLDPENAYLALTTTALPKTGPAFTAIDLGQAGKGIAVQVRPSDLPPVAVVAAPVSTATTTQLKVPSTAPFYTGAIAEVDDGTTKTAHVVDSIDSVAGNVTVTPLVAAAAPTSIRILEFALLVFEDEVLKETFSHLTWNSNNTSRYFVTRIKDVDTGSRLVTVEDPSPGTTPAEQPNTPDGFPLSLDPGSDGPLPVPVDIIGHDSGPGQRTGIQALIEREGIALIAAPGITDEEVQAALITQCELLKYRFAVLDGKPNTSDVSAIQIHRNNYDSKYAAYYAPWLETLDLSSGKTLLIPPSGAVLGIYARSDNERGVHKAPANEVLRSTKDLEFQFSTGEQDVLNPTGVNLIRLFTQNGIRVWGARTVSSDPEWKYINVRRLFIYLEHSIDIGTQWVVFEPNNEALWARVVETITPFLIGVWKTGALMGSKPEEAFFVRCDRSTMTQDDIDNGRLVCLIGVAPTKPAEFVVFRIGQFTAQAST